MPISNPWHLPTVLHYATALQPIKILDVGVGMGAYGFNLRQYLDITAERLERSSWRARIEGVELFMPYKNPVWDYYYDKIHIGDVRAVLPTLGRYDLIICADVLEHFDLSEARNLIDLCLDKADTLIATTPLGHYPQGVWGGNEAESHRCTLAVRDFPHLVARATTRETGVYVCSKNSEARRIVSAARLTCPRIRMGALGPLILRVLNKLRMLNR